MPTSARRKPRARRSAPQGWRDRLPTPEQRHWDLVGLALVAAGVFLGFLVYLGGDGGEAGTATVDGLRRLVGELHYVVPVALLAAGAVLVMRPVLPAVRPFRAAAACLFVGGCLALAAGTLGVGGGPRREDAGGLVGEQLLDATSTLVGDVGAHMIALFCLLAGVLLLTGASVASLIAATSAGVAAHDHGRPHGRGAPPAAARGARRARGGGLRDRRPARGRGGLLVGPGSLPRDLRQPH